MSLGAMLNTRTIGYLELIGNGKRCHTSPTAATTRVRWLFRRRVIAIC